MSKKKYTIAQISPAGYILSLYTLDMFAGAYLPADIYVRYLKGKGHDVLFVCGSDEHGAAITLTCKKRRCEYLKK